MVRTGSEVLTATVVGSDGLEYPLPLSEVVTEFNLRFGAIPLPQGVAVAALRFTDKSGQALASRQVRSPTGPMRARQDCGWEPLADR